MFTRAFVGFMRGVQWACLEDHAPAGCCASLQRHHTSVAFSVFSLDISKLSEVPQRWTRDLMPKAFTWERGSSKRPKRDPPGVELWV